MTDSQHQVETTEAGNVKFLQSYFVMYGCTNKEFYKILP